jgi:hypothetical protein
MTQAGAGPDLVPRPTALPPSSEFDPQPLRAGLTFCRPALRASHRFCSVISFSTWQRQVGLLLMTPVGAGPDLVPRPTALPPSSEFDPQPLRAGLTFCRPALRASHRFCSVISFSTWQSQVGLLLMTPVGAGPDLARALRRSSSSETDTPALPDWADV